MELDVPALLSKIILGLLIGALGQAVRAIIGLKKASDSAAAQSVAFGEVFDSSRLAVSLMIGAVAGGLATLGFLDDKTFTRDHIFLLLAAGYGGADFIEGFMRSQSTKLGATAGAQPASQLPGGDSGTAPLPRANPFPPTSPTPTAAPDVLPRSSPFGGNETPDGLPRNNPFGQ